MLFLIEFEKTVSTSRFCLHSKNAANLGKCKKSSSFNVNKIFWVSWFWSISIILLYKIKNTRYYYKLLDLEFFFLDINLFSITTEIPFWDYERFKIRSIIVFIRVKKKNGRRGIAPTRNCTHIFRNLIKLFACTVHKAFFSHNFFSLSDSFPWWI